MLRYNRRNVQQGNGRRNNRTNQFFFARQKMQSEAIKPIYFGPEVYKAGNKTKKVETKKAEKGCHEKF